MKTVILIEDLWSFKKGHLRNAYQKPLEDMGYKVTSVPWTTKEPLFAGVIIAHGFGAGKVFRTPISCKLLITIDAREWLMWRSQKYRKPWGVEQHFNYYQTNKSRGWIVDEARNYGDKHISHTELPQHFSRPVLDKARGRRE